MSAGLSLTKISGVPWAVEHNLEECGQFYIGQTVRSFDSSLNYHHWPIILEKPQKSALAKHSI
jgi:hypothetical protein